MRKHKKLLIGIVIVGVISLYAGYADLFHVYTLRDDNGGQIVWNADQAYLFMTVARRGYRMSYAEFARGALMQWFNAPPPPTTQHVVLTVIHVTPSGVERHVAKVAENTADIPHFFTPIGGTIYAFSEGTLYKWAGDHFENATPEEQKKMGGMENLFHLSPDIDTTTNGWSTRGIGQVAGDFQLSVEMGKQVTLKIRQGNVYKSPTDTATVDLCRVGQPPQQLWHVNGDPRRVSKREYERALSRAGTL